MRETEKRLRMCKEIMRSAILNFLTSARKESEKKDLQSWLKRSFTIQMLLRRMRSGSENPGRVFSLEVNSEMRKGRNFEKLINVRNRLFQV